MNRDLDKLRAWERRSRARSRLKQSGGLARGKGVRRKNPERKALLFIEQYGGPDGEHHHFVRADGCAVKRRGHLGCWGGNQSSHHPSRGAGGTWRDQHCLCAGHHYELGQIGAETFQRKYDIDLRAENRRLVVEHYGEAA